MLNAINSLQNSSFQVQLDALNLASKPSSCLNNEVIETFPLSNGSMCELVRIDPDDTDSLKEYLAVASNFHYSDYCKKNPLRSNEDDAKFRTILSGRANGDTQLFLNGEEPLIVLRTGNTIIGGSFYVFRENKGTVLMQIASVDRELPKDDYEQCFKAIVNHLCSSRHFPDSSRFVVLARGWSEEMRLITELCSTSDFEMDERYQINGYVAYERPIK